MAGRMRSVFVTGGLHGDEARCNVVRGDVEDGALVLRALGEYDADTVFHLAAQTLVPTANRSPRSTWETNVRGTWTVLEACRELGVACTVVAASDKAYGPHDEAALHGVPRAAPTLPLRRLQGRGRPDRPLLLAHLRPARGHHALRQPLRRGDQTARGWSPRRSPRRWAGGRR